MDTPNSDQVDSTATVFASDYRPLNRDGIRKLLVLAAMTSNVDAQNKIQIRLYQGIKGMTTPRPDVGPIANRMSIMGTLFCHPISKHVTEELVDVFDLLLNG